MTILITNPSVAKFYGSKGNVQIIKSWNAIPVYMPKDEKNSCVVVCGTFCFQCMYPFPLSRNRTKRFLPSSEQLVGSQFHSRFAHLAGPITTRQQLR